MVGQPATQTRFPWAAVILGLVGIAILVSLGTWQVRRLAWKEGLLAEIDRRIHSQARPLADLEKQFAEGADVGLSLSVQGLNTGVLGGSVQGARRHVLRPPAIRAGRSVSRGDRPSVASPELAPEDSTMASGGEEQRQDCLRAVHGVTSTTGLVASAIHPKQPSAGR